MRATFADSENSDAALALELSYEILMMTNNWWSTAKTCPGTDWVGSDFTVQAAPGLNLLIHCGAANKQGRREKVHRLKSPWLTTTARMTALWGQLESSRAREVIAKSFFRLWKFHVVIFQTPQINSASKIQGMLPRDVSQLEANHLNKTFIKFSPQKPFFSPHSTEYLMISHGRVEAEKLLKKIFSLGLAAELFPQLAWKLKTNGKSWSSKVRECKRVFSEETDRRARASGVEQQHEMQTFLKYSCDVGFWRIFSILSGIFPRMTRLSAASLFFRRLQSEPSDELKFASTIRVMKKQSDLVGFMQHKVSRVCRFPLKLLSICQTSKASWIFRIHLGDEEPAKQSRASFTWRSHIWMACAAVTKWSKCRVHGWVNTSCSSEMAFWVATRQTRCSVVEFVQKLCGCSSAIERGETCWVNLQSVVHRRKQRAHCGIERKSLIMEYSKDCVDETSREREHLLRFPEWIFYICEIRKRAFSEGRKVFHPARRRFINSHEVEKRKAFSSHNINQIFTRERGSLDNQKEISEWFRQREHKIEIKLIQLLPRSVGGDYETGKATGMCERRRSRFFMHISLDPPHRWWGEKILRAKTTRAQIAMLPSTFIYRTNVFCIIGNDFSSTLAISQPEAVYFTAGLHRDEKARLTAVCCIVRQIRNFQCCGSVDFRPPHPSGRDTSEVRGRWAKRLRIMTQKLITFSNYSSLHRSKSYKT